MSDKKSDIKIGYIYLISLAVIITDQIVKMLVHFNMTLGSSGQIKILGDFFKLHYLRNFGMAFGLDLPFEHGKILLTIFRIVAMFIIAVYIYKSTLKGAHKGFLICVGLILGGAVGNLIDSIFYGPLFGIYEPGSPTPWFYGGVVDMFYIDIWEGEIFGRYMSLWPVFNIADASIFISICIILIWQRRFFPEEDKSNSSVAKPDHQPETSTSGDTG